MLYLKQGITNTVYANLLDSNDDTAIGGLGNNLVLNSGFTDLPLGVNWNNLDGNAIFSGTNVKIENISPTLNRIQQASVTEVGKSYRVTYSISASTYLGELEYYDGSVFQPISIQGGVNTFDYLRVGPNNSVIINSKLGVGAPPYVIIEYITVQEIIDFSWLINITNDFTKESTTLLQIPDTSVIITPGTNTVSYPIKVITTGTANGLLQEVLLENTGYYSYEIYKQDSVTNLDITDAVVGKLVESGKALIYNADSEVTYKEHPDGNPNNFIYVP